MQMTKLSLIVVALSLWCCDETETPIERTPTPSSEPEPTERPAEKSAQKPPQKPAEAGRLYHFSDLSRDGKRALLYTTDFDPNQPKRAQRFRVVKVDSGEVEADIDVPALSALPLETVADDGGQQRSVDGQLKDPSLVKELAQMAKLLSGFSLGVSHRMAAAPDGSLIAFNAGDWLYLADHKTVLRRLDQRVAYRPIFSPDGTRLFYERLNGTLDGVVGRYEVFVADPSQPSRPALLIAGATAPRDTMVYVAEREAFFLIASHPPEVQTCLLALPVKPPHSVEKLYCAEAKEELSDAAISPKGRYLLLKTHWRTEEDDPRSTIIQPDGSKKLAKKLAWRTRIVDVGKKKVLVDETESQGHALAVNDAGVAVVERPPVLQAIDATSGKRWTVDERKPPGGVVTGGVFRTPAELVFARDGSARVLRIPKPPP